MATLREGGRLAIIGQLGGSRGELDLAQLPAKRAMIHAARLRSRPAHEKATIVAATHRLIEPLAAAGQLRPVIDRVLSLDDAAKARCLVESGEHVSKVLLRP